MIFFADFLIILNKNWKSTEINDSIDIIGVESSSDRVQGRAFGMKFVMMKLVLIQSVLLRPLTWRRSTSGLPSSRLCKWIGNYNFITVIWLMTGAQYYWTICFQWISFITKQCNDSKLFLSELEKNLYFRTTSNCISFL